MVLLDRRKQGAWVCTQRQGGAWDISSAWCERESVRPGRGPGGGGGRGHKGPGGGGVSVEELVWRIRRLPAREPIAATAAGCLPGLDSRACAALLKELARTGLAHRAQEFFDHVLGLGDSAEAARLADVYTYTAAISICVSAQQVPPAPSMCV